MAVHYIPHRIASENSVSYFTNQFDDVLVSDITRARSPRTVDAYPIEAPTA
jgi:hypothetical protein